MLKSNSLPPMADLNRELSPYQKSEMRKPLIQLANTVLPYIALWVAMAFSLRVSYWLTLALAVPAALFLMRIFIFFHDCGHNSFFPSTQLNRAVGFWLGVLVWTPGEQWWHDHAIHHATAGNLDKRGHGDVTTLTVEEYCRLPWASRLGYRLFRNPLVMFGLGPLYMFVIMHRLPIPHYGRKETLSVIYADLAILGMAALISLAIGWQGYLLIQLPLIWLAGMGGIWLFYVQHQYPDVYWVRNGQWSYAASALKGASFYHLPRVLQWFSGNIGFHQIHHLSPRIPNYQLDRAYAQSTLIRQYTRVISLRESLTCLGCKLWDEASQRMVNFPQG